LHRKCLLIHIIAKTGGKDEKMRKKMYADIRRPKGGEDNWNLKEEALDHSLWKTHFGIGYGPFTRQTKQ